jgi:hypothetical protein
VIPVATITMQIWDAVEGIAGFYGVYIRVGMALNNSYL